MTEQPNPHGPTGGPDRKAQAKHLFDHLLKTAGQARDAAGRLVHDNRGRIDAALDKAASVVDERTGGKHAATIAKVKAGAAKGVDLVEGPGDADPGPGAPGDGRP